MKMYGLEPRGKMNEIIIITSPETGSDTQHMLIRDTRFYSVS